MLIGLGVWTSERPSCQRIQQIIAAVLLKMEARPSDGSDREDSDGAVAVACRNSCKTSNEVENTEVKSRYADYPPQSCFEQSTASPIVS